MLSGESFIFFNLLAGGDYSPFIQLIREDFQGEVAWGSCSKESSQRSWARECGFRCIFPSPGWAGEGICSEPWTFLP